MLKPIVCLVITVSLLCNSTPAAAETIVGVTDDWRVSFTFWLHASGALAALQRLLAGEYSRTKPQEKQSERDARVSHIRISPGEVTAHIGEVVRFSAISYGENGDTIAGVKFRWSTRGAKEGTAFINSAGEFSALEHGKFEISVSGAGHTTQTVVTVLKNAPVTKEPQLNRSFSTRNTSPRDTQQAKTETKTIFRKASFNAAASLATSAPPPLPQGSDTYGWNLVNYMTADDPGSQVGDPPGAPIDDGAGNGNFQLTAPVLSLPGRGLDVSLALSYNAHLWHKAGNNITYDIDRGWPSAGWSLGFGKMADIGDGGSILIDSDGTRHGFNGTATGPIANSSFSGRTNDGSFIDYSCVRQNGVIIFGSATLPNGTRVSFGAFGDGAIYPTSIIDQNGNYVTITYRNNAGPQIDTVTDTLGRVINFYYDTNNLLTAITAPAYNGAGTRTLVRLHYQQQFVGPSFSGVTPLVRAPSTRWLLDAIYYPATSTGYWFNDTDSFLSTYGTIAKVEEQRGMTHASTGLTDMGTVSAGTMTSKAVYGWVTSLTDAPTYTTMTESWAFIDTAPSVTNYLINENSSPRTSTITLPNGVKSIQYSHNAPGQSYDGMIFKDETYDTDGTTLLVRNEVNWETGDYNSARPTYTKTTTRQGTSYVTTGTEFSYQATPSFNQVTEMRSYDYGYVPLGTNVLLRKTVSQYENSSNYTNRHIFNLPKIVTVYSGTGATVSQTEYTYDGVTLQNTPSVVQHLDESNPYAASVTQPGHYITQCTGCPPCSCVPVWIPPSTSNPYKPETDYRGNVTQIKTYADVATLDQPTAVVNTRSYDITGNMVKSTTSCCEETSLEFTTSTQYAYPEKQTRGSATDQFAQVVTKATYDFNTGLNITTNDANDRQSISSYDPNTLRLASSISPTGAHTDYDYNNATMTLTATSYASSGEGGLIADQSVQLLNGKGQVRQEQALGANGIWDFVDTTYDNMSRQSQQTQPYRTGDTKQWSTITYDGLDRILTMATPDGSTTSFFYNELARPSGASSNPGDTTRIQDPWGRERWRRTDANGWPIEIMEPDPNGNGSVSTGGLLTTYSYNTLGDLTQIIQGDQTRSFKYDSLGRLLAQKLAEANASLNDAGTYVGAGTWSDVFTYDVRSNLTSRTDARGVKTVYNYNGDPLNRLQSISWDTTGFGDTTNPIVAAATVTYSYRTKTAGPDILDVTQLNSIAAAGVSTESFGYDTEGRVSSKTLTLTSRASYPFVMDYIYDSLDRIKDLRYPAEYGNGSAARKVVHHDYDVASRLSGVTFDGQTHASSITYTAASQTKSLYVGTGPNQVTENYNYNAQTGWLEQQTATRGGTTLLDLSYDYAGPNGKRTGQLTKILNNQNHNKDRGYTYDALGRLKQATGGPSASPIWTQTYAYDRYGNRTSVSASGYSAKNERHGAEPKKDLLAKNVFEPPLFMRDETKPVSDSPLTLKGLNADFPSATSPPQSGPPTFTDDPLAAGVTVKAIHVTQLRDAINQLRQRAALPQVSWAETVSTGVLIKASHITEMRTGLEQARTALGLGPTTYTDPGLTVGTVIKKEHIQEIRDSLKAAWTVSSQISRDGYASLSYQLSSNRITTAGFGYDAAGNQVRALAGSVSQRFQYDAANRMVSVKTDDNSIVLASYTYGCSSERLVGEEGGTRTYYVDDAEKTVAEFSESGASTTPLWSKSYVFLDGRLLSVLTPDGSGGDAVEYQHPDRLGTRLVTNPVTGTSLEQVTLPFGTVINSESTNTTTKRRFTSYERSGATGLDYAINRHYDSQQGRFTQVDPLGMGSVDLTDPQTLNLYAYCANDPINRFDSNGLFWGKLFGFLRKALSVFSKVIKWLVVATLVAAGLAVAFAFLGIPGAAFLWSLAGHLFGVLKLISGALGAVFAKIKGAIKGIFSFAAAFRGGDESQEKDGFGILGALLAADLLIKKHHRRVKRRRRQRRKQDVRTQPAPSVPATPPAPGTKIETRPMEPGPADLDDRYTIETCRYYGQSGRSDLEGICRWFGNGKWSNCMRRCLLENYGTSPGGVYGQDGGYQDSFPTYGPIVHAKCGAKCTGKSLLNPQHVIF